MDLESRVIEGYATLGEDRIKRIALCGIRFFMKVEYSSASSHMAFGSFPRFA